jgi:putative ABC transport system substrate-binding protein
MQFDQIKRREFITLLGGVAAWPLAARAQQQQMPVIGLLSTRSPAVDTPLIALIRQGLGESGVVEGQNIAFDYRWAEGQYDRLAGLATDLVRRQVAVIITMGGELSALAAKAATSTIPIVFAVGTDPTRSGLAASLRRPNGNLTGVSTLAAHSCIWQRARPRCQPSRVWQGPKSIHRGRCESLSAFQRVDRLTS